MLSIIKRIRNFSPVCYLHLLSVVVFGKYSFFREIYALIFKYYTNRGQKQAHSVRPRASCRRLVRAKIKVIAGCQQQKKDNKEQGIAPTDQKGRYLADEVTYFFTAQFDVVLLVGGLFFHFFVIHLLFV